MAEPAPPTWASLVAGGAAERCEDASFVATCRAQYVDRGYCHVPDFLPPRTVDALRAEAERLLSGDGTYFESTERHTVYQEEPDPELPPDHPRNALQRSSKRIVDYARLAPSSPLRALYTARSLRPFVQAVVGVGTLHLSACPYNAAYYNGFREGDGLGWHFDRSEFGVALLLQEPSEGGVFEHVHSTRSEADSWAFDRVAAVLSAERGGVAVDAAAGGLTIFEGRLDLHRVTSVKGRRPRVNAIFTYEKEPLQRANACSLARFFGRSAEEHS